MAVGSPSSVCDPVLILSGCPVSGTGTYTGRSGTGVTGCSGFAWGL